MSDVPLRSTTFPTPKTHNTTCACCCTRKEIKYYEEKYEEKQNMKRLCNNDTSSRRDILFLRPDMGQGKLLLFHFFVFFCFFVSDRWHDRSWWVRAHGRVAWKKLRTATRKRKRDCFLSPFIFEGLHVNFLFGEKTETKTHLTMFSRKGQYYQQEQHESIYLYIMSYTL